MAPSSPTRGAASSSATLADAASWYCAIVILALILIGSIRGNSLADEPHDYDQVTRPGNQLLNRRPCDEIYVVGEGETLHTISDKCGDPFIVERNPHIHDPDDVFPGLVIKIISPSTPRKLLSGLDEEEKSKLYQDIRAYKLNMTSRAGKNEETPPSV